MTKFSIPKKLLWRYVSQKIAEYRKVFKFVYFLKEIDQCYRKTTCIDSLHNLEASVVTWNKAK